MQFKKCLNCGGYAVPFNWFGVDANRCLTCDRKVIEQFKMTEPVEYDTHDGCRVCKKNSNVINRVYDKFCSTTKGCTGCDTNYTDVRIRKPYPPTIKVICSNCDTPLIFDSKKCPTLTTATTEHCPKCQEFFHVFWLKEILPDWTKERVISDSDWNEFQKFKLLKDDFKKFTRYRSMSKDFSSCLEKLGHTIKRVEYSVRENANIEDALCELGVGVDNLENCVNLIEQDPQLWAVEDEDKKKFHEEHEKDFEDRLKKIAKNSKNDFYSDPYDQENLSDEESAFEEEEEEYQRNFHNNDEEDNDEELFDDLSPYDDDANAERIKNKKKYKREEQHRFKQYYNTNDDLNRELNDYYKDWNFKNYEFFFSEVTLEDDYFEIPFELTAGVIT